MRTEPQGRRNWLLRILVGSISVTIGAILYPVARFLRPRPQTSSGALEVVAPYQVSDLRPDANGDWPAPFNFGGKPCLVIRTPEGDVKAFNAVCTHTDCTVKFRVEKNDIFCTCHGGVYNTNGKNVAGPPPRPLEAYNVILRGTPGKEDIIVTAKG